MTPLKGTRTLHGRHIVGHRLPTLGLHWGDITVWFGAFGRPLTGCRAEAHGLPEGAGAAGGPEEATLTSGAEGGGDGQAVFLVVDGILGEGTTAEGGAIILTAAGG